MRFLPWLSRRAKVEPFERAIDCYEANVRAGGPSLGRYWAGLRSGKDPSILAALVKVDLKLRFEAGERPRVLEYLDEFPVLTEVDDRVVSLVYEEFCLLEESGGKPDSQVFCDVYHRWGDSLRSQLVYHRELSRAIGVEAPKVDFPVPGDLFDNFRLTSVLGEGGIARVYLANEEELGGRQVVIKVSRSVGQEPSILAKLDHRHIVPIFRVATSDSGLRGICMPYRPGATLDGLIAKLGRGTPPRRARAIRDASRPMGSAPESPTDDQCAGWNDFPIKRTFPEAVAWLGLAMAEALAYLHKRGIYHRDIKPANILLSYREGPQLLDFNLAQDPNSPRGASEAQRGGTLPYMAPEQLRAYLDPDAWNVVESAADLYSLGLVLRELLTGQPPELPTSRGSLDREIQSLIDRRHAPRQSIVEINPAVPEAFESIIGKCLAFDPEDRYASANELATDLRQFLAREPLRFAPNTSKFELFANWVYRHRQALITAFFVVVLVGFATREGAGRLQLTRAEAYLKSGTKEDLIVARSMFETLRVDQPETARSSLGLALTLEKLGDWRSSNRISNLLKEATERRDAEDVIHDRLVLEPRSPMLHLVLGIVLQKQGRLELARESLLKSYEINPAPFSINVILGKIEERTHRHENARKHLTRAIELGRQEGVDRGTLNDLRKSLMQVLVELCDRKLENGLDAKGHADVDACCRAIQEQLKFFQDDRPSVTSMLGIAYHEYLINFYRGCLFSIQGVLDSSLDDPARSSGHFEDARGSFARARGLAPANYQSDNPLLQLQVQEEKLARRSLQFADPR